MKLVVTPDGKEVDSSSEEWRAWCEAKHVIKITKLSARQEYIASVRKVRNDKAANDLMAKVLIIWKLNKN